MCLGLCVHILSDARALLPLPSAVVPLRGLMSHQSAVEPARLTEDRGRTVICVKRASNLRRVSGVKMNTKMYFYTEPNRGFVSNSSARIGRDIASYTSH